MRTVLIRAWRGGRQIIRYETDTDCTDFQTIADGLLVRLDCTRVIINDVDDGAVIASAGEP